MSLIPNLVSFLLSSLSFCNIRKNEFNYEMTKLKSKNKTGKLWVYQEKNMWGLLFFRSFSTHPCSNIDFCHARQAFEMVFDGSLTKTGFLESPKKLLPSKMGLPESIEEKVWYQEFPKLLFLAWSYIKKHNLIDLHNILILETFQ